MSFELVFGLLGLLVFCLEFLHGERQRDYMESNKEVYEGDERVHYCNLLTVL